jgi:hypothetical protein
MRESSEETHSADKPSSAASRRSVVGWRLAVCGVALLALGFVGITWIKARYPVAPAILEGIRRASSLTLYEGLPHHMWEAGALKDELATKKTVQIHGYSFYERALPLTAEEIEALRKLTSSQENYGQKRGEKTCGGFHPDYCLAWQDGNLTYHLLVCFGCGEIKLFSPTSESLVDINSTKALEDALKQKSGQRPERSEPESIDIP